MSSYGMPQLDRYGYIPACAGETEQMLTLADTATVHPRVCGGNVYLTQYSTLPKGTSPRVRGKRTGRGEKSSRQRYIPACAGETPNREDLDAFPTVHPRVCGGNQERTILPESSKGTSPRVRGKPEFPCVENIVVGYIPACAGETGPAFHGCIVPGVHPRVCGGNSTIESCRISSSGTSPRVRGKQ